MNVHSKMTLKEIARSGARVSHAKASLAIAAAALFTGVMSPAVFAAAHGSSADDVAIFATMSVKDENIAALNDLVGRLNDIVSAEPGTLIYEFSRAGNTVFLYERYDDLSAVMAHVENTGAMVQELFGLVEVTSVVTLTTLPEELRPTFEQMHAVMAEPMAAGAN